MHRPHADVERQRASVGPGDNTETGAKAYPQPLRLIAPPTVAGFGDTLTHADETAPAP
jgi:hypothetical protein